MSELGLDIVAGGVFGRGSKKSTPDVGLWSDDWRSLRSLWTRVLIFYQWSVPTFGICCGSGRNLLSSIVWILVRL